MPLFTSTESIEEDVMEEKERSVEELFQELKQEMDFLPADDLVREGYLFGFEFLLLT